MTLAAVIRTIEDMTSSITGATPGTSAFDGSLRNLAAGACRWAERGLAERCRLLLATHRAVAGRGGGLGPDRVPDQGRRRAIGGGRNGWPVRTPC